MSSLEVRGRATLKAIHTEVVDVGVIDLGRIGQRVVEGRFAGGNMPSDGGVMLLSQVDRQRGMIAAASGCIAVPRYPLLIKHAVRDMLGQLASMPCGDG